MGSSPPKRGRHLIDFDTGRSTFVLHDSANRLSPLVNRSFQAFDSDDSDSDSKQQHLNIDRLLNNIHSDSESEACRDNRQPSAAARALRLTSSSISSAASSPASETCKRDRNESWSPAAESRATNENVCLSPGLFDSSGDSSFGSKPTFTNKLFSPIKKNAPTQAHDSEVKPRFQELHGWVPASDRESAPDSDCSDSEIHYQNEFAKFLHHQGDEKPSNLATNTIETPIDRRPPKSDRVYNFESSGDEAQSRCSSQVPRARDERLSSSDWSDFSTTSSSPLSTSSEEEAFDPFDLSKRGFQFSRREKLVPDPLQPDWIIRSVEAVKPPTHFLRQLQESFVPARRVARRTASGYIPSPRCARIKRAEQLLARSASPELVEQRCHLSKIGAKVLGSTVVAVPISSQSACRKPTEVLNTTRKVRFYCSYHKQLVQLRQQIVRLIHFAFPALRHFNSCTERVEVLMDQIMRILSQPSSDAIDDIVAVHMDERTCCDARVIMCSTMSRTCLYNFRRKICTFLRYILPDLPLSPDAYQAGKYIDELLAQVVQVNCSEGS